MTENLYKETPAIQAVDAAAAAVQKTPNRVSSAKIQNKIASVDFLYPEKTPHVTVCIITMKNGFVVAGLSAPADPKNFNKELGQDFAYNDAFNKIWPMEGYLLREKLYNESLSPPDAAAPAETAA